MLNLITRIFMAATIASAALCVCIVFRNKPAGSSTIILPGNGLGKSTLEAEQKRRNKRIAAAFCSALIFLVLTISTIGFSRSAPSSSPSPSATISDMQIVLNSATPAITPTPVASVEGTVPYNLFYCLDEINPVYPKPGNFFSGGWGDKTDFCIDDTTYPHGLGMCISGTGYEKTVARENTPENTIRWDCKEVSLDYPLRYKYERMIFSIGVDKSDPSLFGPKETNGLAQVVLTDVDAKNGDVKNVLFDTDWEDYSYALYEKTVPLANVDVLRITIRSSGVDIRIHKSLRFVIANPILIMKGDSE